MSACCYIIFSETLNRFYVGATQDELIKRIQKHNDHSYGNHRYTAAASDWKLVLQIPALDYSHAIRMERKIKSMKSSKYIQNLSIYPELLEKLLQTTST